MGRKYLLNAKWTTISGTAENHASIILLMIEDLTLRGVEEKFICGLAENWYYAQLKKWDF